MSHSQNAQVHSMECSTLHQLLFEFTALVENSSPALHSKQSTELTKLPKLAGNTATSLWETCPDTVRDEMKCALGSW